MTHQELEISDEDLTILRWPPAATPYEIWPIPSERDTKIAQLIGRAIQQDQVRHLCARLQRADWDALAIFADRMSAIAVRNRSRADLQVALVALLIAYRLGPDARDSMRVFAVISDAIERIGIGVADFLTSARSLVGDEMIEAFAAYMQRPSRTLKSMFYRIGADQNGFRYISEA